MVLLSKSVLVIWSVVRLDQGLLEKSWRLSKKGKYRDVLGMRMYGLGRLMYRLGACVDVVEVVVEAWLDGLVLMVAVLERKASCRFCSFWSVCHASICVSTLGMSDGVLMCSLWGLWIDSARSGFACVSGISARRARINSIIGLILLTCRRHRLTFALALMGFWRMLLKASLVLELDASS